MRIDIAKIDERISKLQTIRRIASDPELSRLLLEFLAGDPDASGFTETASAMMPENGTAALATAAASDMQDEDEASKLMSGILKGDSKTALGLGHWSKRRA